MALWLRHLLAGLIMRIAWHGEHVPFHFLGLYETWHGYSPAELNRSLLE